MSYVLFYDILLSFLSWIVKLKFKNIWLGEAMSEKQSDPPAPNLPPTTNEQPTGTILPIQRRLKQNRSK
jgi:hypothetical protein